MEEQGNKDYYVLLYYRFTPVPHPESIVEQQDSFCREHNLLGRILIAEEGINGTVSGLKDDCEAYMQMMQKHPLFEGIEFKIDEHDGHTFHKLHVRVKPEIVHFGVDGLRPPARANNYVEPDEFREILKSDDPDVVILDARSNYETNLGKFKGAMSLDIENFRDLPDKIEELKPLKNKKIYTYCTGGIKCEKVSAWLEENGFDEVYQLHGGIVRYGHEVGGEDFEGSCYVFDERVSVPVNEVNPKTISACLVCDEAKSDRMINCANPECNKHFVICDGCAEEMKGCCSEECLNAPRRRKWDGSGQYLRGINSKNYISANQE